MFVVRVEWRVLEAGAVNDRSLRALALTVDLDFESIASGESF
jgi:hypothetical protein